MLSYGEARPPRGAPREASVDEAALGAASPTVADPRRDWVAQREHHIARSDLGSGPVFSRYMCARWALCKSACSCVFDAGRPGCRAPRDQGWPAMWGLRGCGAQSVERELDCIRQGGRLLLSANCHKLQAAPPRVPHAHPPPLMHPVLQQEVSTWHRT